MWFNQSLLTIWFCWVRTGFAQLDSKGQMVKASDSCQTHRGQKAQCFFFVEIAWGISQRLSLRLPDLSDDEWLRPFSFLARMDCPVLDRLRPPRVSCASPFRWHSSCSLFQVRKPGSVGSVVGRFMPCHSLIIPTIMIQWMHWDQLSHFPSFSVIFQGGAYLFLRGKWSQGTFVSLGLLMTLSVLLSLLPFLVLIISPAGAKLVPWKRPWITHGKTRSGRCRIQHPEPTNFHKLSKFRIRDVYK